MDFFEDSPADGTALAAEAVLDLWRAAEALEDVARLVQPYAVGPYSDIWPPLTDELRKTVEILLREVVSRADECAQCAPQTVEAWHAAFPHTAPVASP